MFKSFAGLLVYAFVRMLHSTYRLRTRGVAGLLPPEGCEAYIFAVWHQNLFAGILAQTGRKHVVIVSRSGDGDPVTVLCNRLGHTVMRGSSKKGDVDKGGKVAKDDMIDVLKSGLPGAVTVDGPRGPAHVVKPGIIEMARASGSPIVPYLPLPVSYWSFSSWDKFRLPKPFTRIDIHYGAPIYVPEETQFENFGAFQTQVADALNQLEVAAAA